MSNFWDTESDKRDFYQQQYNCARYLIRDVFTTPMLIKLRDWIDECIKENQGGQYEIYGMGRWNRSK